MTYNEFTKYAKAANHAQEYVAYQRGSGKMAPPSIDDVFKDRSLDDLEAILKSKKADPNTDPNKLKEFENYVTKRRAAGVQPTKPLEGSWLDRNKDWLSGVGAGTAAGLTAYSLAELHPMLRRARFLRTLLGLGVGAGVGIGTGLIVGSK